MKNSSLLIARYLSLYLVALVATPATLISTPLQNQHPILLEAKLLNLIDGAFINANRIEEIKKFRHKLLSLLLGELQPDGTRIGHYIFKGSTHNVQMLQAVEASGINSGELSALLTQAKRDFMTVSDEFRNSARGSKSFIVQLIEESCKRRGRSSDSILLTWAHTPLEKEHAVFQKEVTNFDKLETFLTDLFNFLADLQHSCPKACALFNARVEKYTAVKKLLPQELAKHKEPIDKMAFLAHLKRRHLDNLTLEKITSKTVQALLKEFTQTKSIAIE